MSALPTTLDELERETTVSLLPTTPRLIALAGQVAHSIDERMAPNTRTAYARQWAAFTTWANREGIAPMPAPPELVAAYCADLFASGAAHATIDQALAAISAAHREAGHHQAPTRHELVRATRAGQRRQRATAQRQVAPLTIGELRRVIVRIDPSTSAGLRDRALLLIGWAAALRRSEVVALDATDITPIEGGLALRLRSSKTDQEGRGDVVALPYGSDADTCPVRTLHAWLDHAGIVAGPIFRPIDRHGRIGWARLEGRAVARLIQRRVAATGLDPDRYSGHSLRAGFVTTAAAAGVSTRAIAHQTRHSPTSPVLHRYVRHASPLTDNAVTQVGL